MTTTEKGREELSRFQPVGHHLPRANEGSSIAVLVHNVRRDARGDETYTNHPSMQLNALILAFLAAWVGVLCSAQGSKTYTVASVCVKLERSSILAKLRGRVVKDACIFQKPAGLPRADRCNL